MVGALQLDRECTGEELGRFLGRYNSILDKTELGLYVSEIGRNPADAPEDKDVAPEELAGRQRKRGWTAFQEAVLRGFITQMDFQQVNSPPPPSRALPEGRGTPTSPSQRSSHNSPRRHVHNPNTTPPPLFQPPVAVRTIHDG